MEGILGSSLPAFIVLTVCVFGLCGWLTGQTLAQGWKPWLPVIGYTLLMGVGDRFLVFALFGGELLSLHGFLIHTAIIAAVTVVSYRLTMARRMVSQYPWLYERTGPFSWREKPGAGLAD